MNGDRSPTYDVLCKALQRMDLAERKLKNLEEMEREKKRYAGEYDLKLEGGVKYER